MLRINNVKIYDNFTNEQLLDLICQKFKINKNDVIDFIISKKSIDARKKIDVHFNYCFNIKVKDENKYKKFDKINNVDKTITLKLTDSINTKFNQPPVIIGAGPAGLFSALSFVENGVKPIIIEQGKMVDDRKKDIDNFLSGNKLNPLSNVQFGEGGAGTFSDGKLTTGINNSLCKKVLTEFVRFGAPEEILYLSKIL